MSAFQTPLGTSISKKTSSHAAIYFVPCVFVFLFSFSYLIRAPVTRTAKKNTHTHECILRKTEHDCVTSARTSDTKRERKELTRSGEIRLALLRHYKLFISSSSFFFSRLSKHLRIQDVFKSEFAHGGKTLARLPAHTRNSTQHNTFSNL